MGGGDSILYEKPRITFLRNGNKCRWHWRLGVLHFDVEHVRGGAFHWSTMTRDAQIAEGDTAHLDLAVNVALTAGAQYLSEMARALTQMGGEVYRVIQETK